MKYLLLLPAVCMAEIHDEASIRNTVQHYFTGTYYGDREELTQAFHPDTSITGNINSTIITWTLDEFLTRVTTKPTAAEKNEKFDKTILQIDYTNQIAMVKTRVVVGEYVFTDYIILIKLNDQWVIRYKSFTT